MNALIAFFMWLFGWTGPGVAAESQPMTVTPQVQPARSSMEGFEPERFNRDRSQEVTIIIYDDTFFKAY